MGFGSFSNREYWYSSTLSKNHQCCFTTHFTNVFSVIFPCLCKGDIFWIAFFFFAEISGAEGLIGWGQLFVKEVSVAITHEGSFSIGQLFLTAPFINRHESGEFWLALLLPFRRSANWHPAGVRVAIFITLSGTLPCQGYIWQRPWIWK